MTETVSDFRATEVFENGIGEIYVLMPGQSFGPIPDTVTADQIRKFIVLAYVTGRQDAKDEIRKALGVN